MRTPGGYAVWTEADGQVRECDSYTCRHCQFVVFVPPKTDPANLGGLCKQCMGLICPKCVVKGTCTPFEKALEQMEAKDRFLRSAGLAVLLLLLLVSPGETYTIRGEKWQAATITYYINPANSDLPADRTIALVQQAAAIWNAVPAGQPHLVYGGTYTDACTIAYDGRNAVCFSAEARSTVGSGIYHHDGVRILEGDTALYSGNYRFYDDSETCSGSGMYLLDAQVHEFGHVLGLDHSTVAGATMQAGARWCSQDYRTLHDDDMAGLRALYGGVADPMPVACVVSAWSAWSPCVDGVQSRTRTVLVPPSNGGAPCPALVEARSCTVSPPKPCRGKKCR